MPEPLEAEVVEVAFKTTRYGNVVPVVILNPVIEQAKCPNIHTLQKQGIWEGDYVTVDATTGKISVDLTRRPVDATPPKLLHGCPDCGYELEILLDRRLSVKCPNKGYCSAQVA